METYVKNVFLNMLPYWQSVSGVGESCKMHLVETCKSVFVKAVGRGLLLKRAQLFHLYFV